MIKAIALDVDGVLTDGGFWWDAAGAELKRFCFRDVMGIARASREGMVFALISGEKNPIVDRYAAKLEIKHVWQGCKEKDRALREFAEATGLRLEEIGFMGDDVNDLAAMAIAGFAAAPADAHESVHAAVKLVTKRPGGNGAVREMLDFLKLAQ
ncbi:MAG: HAD hydrolase family protein [Chthoniobacteraceae bacterium]|jgi:3-deoxy-D-manno-octulosonate 8-phosphate phosphatase (KDO 8-P phosphatase)